MMCFDHSQQSMNSQARFYNPPRSLQAKFQGGWEPAKTRILRQVFVFDNDPFRLWQSTVFDGSWSLWKISKDQITLKLTTLKLLGIFCLGAYEVAWSLQARLRGPMDFTIGRQG